MLEKGETQLKKEKCRTRCKKKKIEIECSNYGEMVIFAIECPLRKKNEKLV